MSHDKVTRQRVAARLRRQSRKAKQVCVSCREPSGSFAECVRCRAKKRYAHWKRKFFEGYHRTTLALPLNLPAELMGWNLSGGLM